jgi:hypothetical protein
VNLWNQTVKPITLESWRELQEIIRASFQPEMYRQYLKGSYDPSHLDPAIGSLYDDLRRMQVEFEIDSK